MKTINTFSLIKAMLDIAPKKDVRYYLNGVHISRGTSPEVTIEATDGHSLLRVILNAPEVDVICVAENTDVIIKRESLLNMIKMFTYKNPPIISAKGTQAHLDTQDFSQNIALETTDGRFPDTGRLLSARTDRTLTANEQGVRLELLARVAKATSKLVEYAVFSAHEGNGFKFTKETEAGTITALVMPCRL